MCGWQFLNNCFCWRIDTIVELSVEEHSQTVIRRFMIMVLVIVSKLHNACKLLQVMIKRNIWHKLCEVKSESLGGFRFALYTKL